MTEFELKGLRADNPLGFLAALGCLRVVSTALPSSTARMSWHLGSDSWTPRLRIGTPSNSPEDGTGAPDTDAALAEALDAWMRQSSGLAAFRIGNDLTLSPQALRTVSVQAADRATADQRDFADFVAAFGCDAVEAVANGKLSGKMADTAFRTMSGAGHQHFLGFMVTLAEDCTADHLHRALFSSWRYDDPLESHSMRWDPVDDVRYALRWRDSSGDPERKRGGTMWGANRLAIEALPLLPTAAVSSRELATTGFSSSKAEGTAWTWPVWQGWCSVDIVRTMLSLKDLQSPIPPRKTLQRMGITEVFRCQRIRQGKYRNLTPARAV